ncbi:MAG: lysostaphin resistance A-like protein [Actinomycetota bacterium]
MSARALLIPRASPAWLAPAAIALGCAALLARTISYESMGATALVGVLGLVMPVAARAAKTGASRWVAVTLSGFAAFWAGRALGEGVGVRLTTLGVVAIILAAVAEEAFFRRFVYGWAERFGAGTAIAVSTVLFALIHLPMYGGGVMWIDLAAGALLGWQRWATGSWTSPAVTHVVANLLQMG